MIDTHCHLDAPEFDADRDAVVARARAAGVGVIVVPAVRPSTWSAVMELAARYPEVRVALGIHPQVVPSLTEAEMEADVTAAWYRPTRLKGASPPPLGEAERGPPRGGGGSMIAVGECGLDGPTGHHAEQERVFRRQIAAARAARLPLLVHVFRAHDAAPRILAEERAHEVGGILHSYSGGADLVPRYRDLGFAFSFAGPVTWPNARRPVEAAAAVPLDLLLAETDAPDQSPHRGTRSEPAFLRPIHAALARIHGLPEPEMDAILIANARRVLAL